MKNHRKLLWAVFTATALAVLVTVSAVVYAKYVSSSVGVKSELVPAEIDSLSVQLTESTDTNGCYVLSGAQINTQDMGYPVYVRAAVNVVWQNGNGEVYGLQPVEGTDYSFGFNEDDWFRSDDDGLLYCKSIIAAGDAVPALIDADNTVNQLRAAPAEGYSLKAKVSAQYIQAVGTDEDGNPASLEAWGTVPQTDP